MNVAEHSADVVLSVTHRDLRDTEANRVELDSDKLLVKSSVGEPPSVRQKGDGGSLE